MKTTKAYLMIFSFLKFFKVLLSYGNSAGGDEYQIPKKKSRSHFGFLFLNFFLKNIFQKKIQKTFSKKNFAKKFQKTFSRKIFSQKKIFFSTFLFFIFISCEAQIILIDQSKKLCAGDSVYLSVFSGYSNYVWSNGENSPRITVKHEGAYKVTVTDVDGKIFNGSIDVISYANPEPPIIQGTAFICPNGFTTLFVDDIYTDVRWINGVSGLQNTISEPGNYSVTVTDRNGCTATSTDTVRFGKVFPSKLPRTITLCDKDSIVLDATAVGALKYYWNTDDTTTSITVRDSGMYNVIIGNGECVSYDTTFISTIAPPQYNLGNDTSICIGDTIMLRVPKNDAYYYQWQNNAHDTFFVVKDSGLYKLRVSLGSCDTTLQKHVSIFNRQMKTPILDTSVCSVPFRIEPNISDVRAYKWFDGSTNSFIDVNQTGKYNLIAYNKKCYTDVNYVITVLDTPKINLGPDTVVCVTNALPSFILKTNPSPETFYFWSTGATTSSITVNFSGQYYLLAGNKCGSSKGVVNLKFDYCNYVYVPNAFSPNDDGNNDVLQLYPTSNVVKIIQFQIYNRWSVLVFDAGTFDAVDAGQHAWNGKISAGVLSPDVYVYQILFSTSDGKIYQTTGDITLLK